MRRPSYKQAIQWMADNDDTEWADHEDNEISGLGTISVTGCLVADLFDVKEEKVRKDLRRVLNLTFPRT